MKKLVIGIIVGIALVACVAWAARYVDHKCLNDCIMSGRPQDYCMRMCSQ